MKPSGVPDRQSLTEVAKRARRRWLWRLSVIVVASGIAGPVLNSLLTDHHHPTAHRHGGSAVVVVVTLGVLLAAAAAVVVVIGRKSWRNEGFSLLPSLSV